MQFNQPSSSAVTLNRVVGPNPSQIAGRIDANGQVILTNQDGVTFYKGAQVNTAGFVASAPGMTNQNFMAGRMVFDQPAHPGARVTNAGTITVSQAGLAALVAPQVANSGVITAKLGHVVLAGAKTATLDLYGDGLVSLDVTNQVTQTPGGATALVTNTGTIAAQGGTVQLTARAADGVVQTLIQAGGTIAAPSAGGRTGTVVLAGIGGDISIAGQVLAQGLAAGSKGGSIQILPSGTATVAGTARIDASGAAGGGTVALGTTLARAAGGPTVTPTATSRGVVVASGANIAANATAAGNGGHITLLSLDDTVMNGSVVARGGPGGGNGGFVEVSGGSLGYDGTIDVGAPLGQAGTALFDPDTLTIVAGPSGSGGDDHHLITSGGTILQAYNTGSSDLVSDGALSLITSGTILLEAKTLLTVQSGLTFNSGVAAVTMESGGNLIVDSGQSLVMTGAGSNLVLTAGTGALTLTGATLSAPAISLSGGSGGISLDTGAITATGGGVLALSTSGGGSITQAASGVLGAGVLNVAAIGGGSIALGGTANAIATLGGASATASITIDNNATLTIDGPVSGTGVTLSTSTGDLLLVGNVTATGGGTLSLAASAGNIVQSGSSLTAGTLLASAGSGSLDLDAITNAIGTLGAASATTSLVVTNGTSLAVAGAVSGDTVALTTETGALTLAANVTGTTDVALTADSGSITQPSGLINTPSLAATASGSLDLGSVTNAMTLVTGATASGGDVTLTNNGNLTLTGTESGQDVAVTLANSSGTLALGTGALTATVTATAASGNISLVANRITEIAGSTLADAGTLTIAPDTSNGVTIGGSTAGTYLLVDDTLLGEISTTTFTVGSTSTAVNITLAAAHDFTGQAATLDLLTSGSVTQAGALTVGSFAASATQGVTLNSTQNTIGALGSISAGPSLTVANSTVLTVNGPVDAGSIVLSTATGDLTLAGNVTGTTDLALTATAGNVVLTAGSVTAGSVAGSAQGSFLLINTLNAIAALGSITAGGLLEVSTGAAMTANGPLSAAQISLSTNSGDLTLAGSIAGTNDLVLTANSGNVTQSAGGIVTTAALSGSASGGFNLGSTLNAITAVGTVSAGSAATLTVANSTALTVNGPVDAGSVVLSTVTGDLTLAGNVTGTTDLALTATAGNVVLTAGTVTAGSVSGSAQDSFLLINTLNAIAALGSITAGGLLEVSTGAAMTANGPLDAATIDLTTHSGDLTLAGSIAGTSDVTLDANAGNILQTGGSISTASLTANAAGAVDIGSTSNAIALVTGASAGTGDLTLGNGAALTVAGTLTGQDVTVHIANGGVLTLGSGIAATVTATAASGNIALLANQIDEIAGSTVTDAGTLTLAPFSAGAVGLLGGTGLVIDSTLLGEISTTTLAIGSTATATGLVVGGAVDLTGHASTLDLLASGSVTEPGGVLTVGVLGASANGVTLDAATNAIGTLSAASAGSGSLVVTNGSNLVLAGSVGGAGATLEVAATGGTLALGSGATAASVTATGGGGISLLADRITEIAGSGVATTGTLTVAPYSANAISLAGSPGSQLLLDTTLLGEINVGALVVGNLTTTGAISIDGAADLTSHAGTLDLQTTGSISEPGGPLTVGTFAASANGITLDANTNAIGTLDAVAAGSGDLAVINGSNLALAGTESGQDVTLQLAAGGTLALGSGAVAATVTATAAAGNISLLADRITGIAGSAITDAGTLSIAPVSANTVSLAGTAGAHLLLDGTLLGEIGTGTLVVGNLTTTTGISVDGAANLGSHAATLDLQTTGSITEPGGPLTVSVLTATGNGIALGSNTNAIGTVAGATAGSGDLLVVNGSNLTLAGTASGQNVTLEVASTGDTLALGSGAVAASVTATGGAGNISLLADRITEIAGSSVTDAGTLTIAPYTANAVSLAGTAGAHLLLDTTLLGEISTGALVVGNLTTTTGISVDGAVGLTGHAATLDLLTTGSIGEPGGPITVGTLAAAAGTGIALGIATNAIGSVTGATAGSGDLVLVNGGNLTLTGTASGQSVTLEVASTGGTLALGSGATAASVTATGGGSVSLLADRITDIAGNSLATSGTLSIAPYSANAISLAGSPGSYLLLDTMLLGEIDAGTLVVGNLTTASGISVDGAADLTGHAATLDLLTTGSISEPGGPLAVSVLTATGNGIALGSSSNAIGSVAGANAGSGNLLVVNGGNLTLAGTESGQNVTLEVAAAGGTLALGSGHVTAAVTATAAGGGVSLLADRISEIAGSSIAGSGSVTIAPVSANAISLAGTAGTHLLLDTTLLGEISTGTLVVGNLTTATGIAVDGAANLTGHASTLDLLTTGSISEPGGPLTVPTLGATAGSGIALGSAQNAIGTVAGASAGSGNLLLVNGGNLTLAGTESGQNVTLKVAAAGDTLAIGSGAVAASITATAGAGNISLLADRITDIAGSAITDAGTLSIAPVRANAVSLAGTPGGYLLLDSTLLGEISTGSLVVGNLTTTTGISVDGAANLTGHASTLDLQTTGSISEPGGSLAVPVLTATAGSGVALGAAANAIGTVAGATAGSGNLLVVDGGNLTLADTESGQTVTLEVATAGGTLAIGSGATTATVTATGGGITLVADRITDIAGSRVADAGTLAIAPYAANAVSLAGSPGSYLLLDGTLLADISTTTLVVGNPATATGISVDGATDLTGHATTLDLQTSGSITEPGGPLTVGTLTAAAGTGIALGTATNAIGTLDGVTSASGGVVIDDASTLVVAGPVGAGSVTLASSGTLDVLAGITASGEVALDAVAGMTLATGGSLDAGSIALTSGGILDDRAGIAANGSLVASSSGDMTLASSASLSGGGITLASGGTLDVLAGIAGSGQMVLLGGNGLVLAGAAPVAAPAIQLNGGNGGITLAGTGLVGGGTSTLDLIGNGGATQAPASTIAAALLASSTGITGNVTLGGTANAIAALGSFAVAGGTLALADGGAGLLTVAGPVTAQDITLGSSGGEPASIDVIGSVAAGASLALASTSGIALGSAASLDGAAIALASNGPITLAAGAGVGDPAANVSFSSAGGNVIEDTGARITAATLDSQGGIAGAATFAGTLNAVATLENLSAATLLLADGGAGSLAIAGHVAGTQGVLIGSGTQPGAIGLGGTLTGQAVTLDAGSGGIRLAGTLIAGTVAELDTAGGGVQQSGSLAAATLQSAGITGPASFASTDVATLGAFPVTAGGLTLSNTAGIVLAGPVSADGIAIGSAGGMTVAGSLTTGGALMLAATQGGITLGTGGAAAALDGSTVTLAAAGQIGEPNGSITANSFAASGTGSVSLGSARNDIPTLGAVSVPGGSFLLTDSTPPLVTIAGPVTAANVTIGTPASLALAGTILATGVVALSSGSGGIALGTGTAPGVITAGTLVLTTGGTVGEPNGLVIATQLQASSGGALTLGNAGNDIATLGAVSLGSGDLVLADGGAPQLTVFGPLNAANVTLDPPTSLTVTGQITAADQLLLVAGSGGMALAGALNASTLTLVSGGGISEPGGSIAAGTLAGSSAGATTLGGTNAIGLITDFTAGTAFTLADGSDLTLSGVLTAPLVELDMPGNAFTLGSGAAIDVGGVPQPANFVSLDASLGGAQLLVSEVPTAAKPAQSGGLPVGAYLTVGTFTQLGISHINAITAGGSSLLRIDTSGTGNITFANLQGLDTWLLIDVVDGKITGNIYVKSLTLAYPAGYSGATLAGTVNQIGGQAAAGEATILPLPNSQFKLNNCPIHSVNCVLLPVETIPSASPLENFSIGALLDNNDDENLLLPIVSDEDY